MQATGPARRSDPPATAANAARLGPPAGAARPQRPAAALPERIARLAGFAGLAAFGLVHWMAMVAPAATGRALAALAVAVALAAALQTRLARAAGARGDAVTGALLAAGLAGALLAGGATPGALLPGSDLLDRLAAGLSAAVGADIPYAGVDPDLRLAIGAGGAVLAVAAAALACWPRGPRPGAALALLIGLDAVPAIADDVGGDFLRGALLFLLAVAFLRLEAIPARQLPRAAALAVAAGVLALVTAPALDARSPWIRYDDVARDAAAGGGLAFAWDHDYAGLDWPRAGRELLRVTAPRPLYLKARTLDVYDGRWRAGGAPEGDPLRAVAPERLRRDTVRVRVAVRGLRSDTLPLPGFTWDVRPDGADRDASGAWTAPGGLAAGDAYTAEAYAPRPDPRALARAPAATDPSLRAQRRVTAVAPLGGRLRPVAFTVPRFGAAPRARPVATAPGRSGARAGAGTAPGESFARSGTDVLARSELARTWRLARRLRRGAPSPYAYLRRARRHLRRGYRYAERPPPAARTLDGFLFDARAGYCQQFSGSLALLLRLGGVPARVAAGFAPGERRDGAWVVADLQAHSWVEAWFEGVGWVAFDPTPAAAPSRGAAVPGSALAGGIAPAPARAAGRDGGVPWPPLLLAALGGAAAVAARRAHRARPGDEVARLELALRRAGAPPPPAATLAGLARRHPAAAGYLTALAAARYAAGPPPTPAQRRALARALTRERSLTTRLAVRHALGRGGRARV